ncbi:hypothetical protein KNT87_gp011 [Erwinia phage Cronus]|uniref:Uncharacterized protein n=1 Tax=Erwinia phage Cronus TaxID=2163633 RepID=A0A2S1GM42_9CAUD|nr:hypothetical protein KNT87_gp011 [Erwinia phage Cronus]AWD90450.1 hypothetical protein [Erwinia phage Cronus]
MIKVSVDQLIEIYTRLSEFRVFMEKIPARNCSYEERCIIETTSSAMAILRELMESHGSIAFFTQDDHDVYIGKDLTDLLSKIVGWL